MPTRLEKSTSCRTWRIVWTDEGKELRKHKQHLKEKLHTGPKRHGSVTAQITKEGPQWTEVALTEARKYDRVATMLKAALPADDDFQLLPRPDEKDQAVVPSAPESEAQGSPGAASAPEKPLPNKPRSASFLALKVHGMLTFGGGFPG